MKHPHLIYLPILGILLGSSIASHASPGQQPATETVPVSMIVSVEARHGKDIPALNKPDVRVLEGKNQLRVTDWVPLQGSEADLELLVLIDEAASQNVASQYDDLRRFMGAQPATTVIAVGYMEFGTIRMAQDFTKDRDAAGKALRMPMGMMARGSSPYLSINDAIKRWPQNKARHEIFMISSGIDPLQPGILDPYLDQAIQTAQRTGTQLYSIYASRGGHFGHTYWRIVRGQNNLSKMADETGGESYFQGFYTPISFAPFLDEFAERLNHQYRITFLIKPDQKPSYRHVRLETEVPNAELDAADRVYVP